MSPLSEDQWHQRQIRRFVAAEPIKVILQRPTQIATAAGGRIKGQDVDVPEQTFRLTPFKRRLVLEYGLSKDGEEVQNVQWILVGEPDADVEVGDYFVRDRYRYEVKFISDHRRFRTAAGLALRGEILGE